MKDLFLLKRCGDDSIRMDPLTILIGNLIRRFLQKKKWNIRAVLIGLHLLAELKPALPAERLSCDDQIRSKEDDLLQGVFSMLRKEKAVIRALKGCLKFLPGSLV